MGMGMRTGTGMGMGMGKGMGMGNGRNFLLQHSPTTNIVGSQCCVHHLNNMFENVG